MAAAAVGGRTWYACLQLHARASRSWRHRATSRAAIVPRQRRAGRREKRRSPIDRRSSDGPNPVVNLVFGEHVLISLQPGAVVPSGEIDAYLTRPLPKHLCRISMFGLTGNIEFGRHLQGGNDGSSECNKDHRRFIRGL
jgi:hypothetical protein